MTASNSSSSAAVPLTSTKAEVRKLQARMDRVEEDIPAIISATNQVVGNLNEQLSAAVEILDAVVQSLGVETVTEIIQETRRKRSAETEEGNRVAIELSLQGALEGKGGLEVIEAATEDCVLVGKETSAEGEVRHPGRFTLNGLAEIPETYRNELIGKQVGFSMKVENGATLEILELYGRVAPKGE